MAKTKKVEDKVELIYTNHEVEMDVVKDINPLHTKYQKFINQAKDGYLIGLEYPIAMDMLRYCEKKRNCQIGLNMSCPTCLIQLVNMFDNLRERI